MGRRAGEANRPRSLQVVDTHTAGEPTRIVLAGWPPLRGRTMAERLADQRARHDGLRSALLLEPRGHGDQFGALLLPARSPAAHYGLLFLDAGGYLPMCGHATMGVATALVELGIVGARGPEVPLVFETPAGLVRATARVEGGRVREVAVEDVPSWYLGPLAVEVRGRRILVDLAYAGSNCAMVDGAALGLPVRRSHLAELVAAGRELRAAANALAADALELPGSGAVDLVMITGEPELPESRGKNIVVFGAGQFDRSPCATGTAARLAALHARGRLRLGEEFVHESIINTTFRARLLRPVRRGNRRAVVPEIAGRAYITQVCEVRIDPRDPLGAGFRPGSP